MNNNAFSFTLRDQDAPYPEPPQFPSLLGKHVVLRPVTPNDYQTLETEGDLAGRWRWRCMTPSPEQWAHQFWNGVLAQFIMVDRSSGEAAGVDLRLQVDGTALFVDYLFSWWALRTVYMEVPAFNMSQFSSGLGRYFAIEGQLRDNYHCAGKFYDMHARSS
jgi:hypothetical protein